MSRQTQTVEEIRNNLFRHLDWHTAQRDDTRVAQAIHDGEELDAVFGLEEVGLLDEFWHFLKQVGIFPLLEAIRIPAIERVLIPVVTFILLYFLRVLLSIESMNALPPLLFTNTAAMTLLGFNAYQIANGFTKRGDALRKNKKKQGPLTAQCLAQNICKLLPEQMEALLNGVVHKLAAFGMFAKEVSVVVDGSRLETTEKFEGRGCLRLECRVKEKGTGRLVTIEVFLFGWKVIVLMDIRTRIPLAAKVVKIQEYEGVYLLPLLRQAQANLGEYARIVKVVADRIYLDGEDLWELNQMGIIFVVIAKEGMAVREDALALAKLSPNVAERKTVVRHGHGSQQTTAELLTRVIGVEGLTTYDQYGTAEHTRQRNRKGFEGNPIHAVVVELWENEPSSRVYLTNGSVEHPLEAFDDYDDRSTIENGLWREANQAWDFEHYPQRNEAGVMVHVFFTLVVMALATAYRLWKERDKKAPEEPFAVSLLEGQGARAWRRELKAENRNKVIVFVQQYYGIFHVAEFSVLAGLRIRAMGIPPELGTPSDILARYELSP
jgi:hypothetical protein